MQHQKYLNQHWRNYHNQDQVNPVKVVYQSVDGHGHRLFYVNKSFIQRPFNTESNQKNALFSILNLSPNTNTKHVNINHNHNNNDKINQSINNVNHPSTATSNVTSFMNVNKNSNNNISNNNDNKLQIEVNMTSNNKQYDIFMNCEYTKILQFLLITNLQCPLYIRNSFETKLNPEQIRISNGAKRLMFSENAGGASELSEGFSFEVLKKCFGAKLLKTEMEIKYMWFNHWKKTDYSVKIGNNVIGVSVTRAMKYQGLFNKQDAIKLLTKKLNGVIESTEGVLDCHKWQRQILHIWATDKYIETILHETLLELLFDQPELVGDTVVIVTVASEEMWWLFYQDKYMKKNVNKKKMKKKVLKKNLSSQIESKSKVSSLLSSPQVITTAVT
mmetsp:Transcript_12425/g.11031  ORF Transcript_12425/g.11031 Transcript_12425/m.11031 type:complete len:388 (-) Transcript_12425:78-1241(-)